MFQTELTTCLLSSTSMILRDWVKWEKVRCWSLVHSSRTRVHRRYIWHCLQSLSSANVTDLRIEEDSIRRRRWWCSRNCHSWNIHLERTSPSKHCSVSRDRRMGTATDLLFCIEGFVMLFLRMLVSTWYSNIWQWIWRSTSIAWVNMKTWTRYWFEWEDGLSRTDSTFVSRVICIKSSMLYFFVTADESFIVIWSNRSPSSHSTRLQSFALT